MLAGSGSRLYTQLVERFDDSKHHLRPYLLFAEHKKKKANGTGSNCTRSCCLRGRMLSWRTREEVINTSFMVIEKLLFAENIQPRHVICSHSLSLPSNGHSRGWSMIRVQHVRPRTIAMRQNIRIGLYEKNAARPVLRQHKQPTNSSPLFQQQQHGPGRQT